MNSELQKQLAEILAGVSNTAVEAKNFVLAELPDVVQQTLLWYGIYNAILTLSGIFILYLTYKTTKWMLTKPKENISSIFWEWNTYNEKHSPDVGFISIILLVFPFIIGIEMLNIEWLKIWIAPKLWLIEFSSALIK